jgi:chromosomal replication initiation ATPase DnaA
MMTRRDTCPLCKDSVSKRIARFYNTDIDVVRSSSRKQSLVCIRLAIVYVATRYFTYTSLQQRGLLIGRDHATVIWLMARTNNQYDHLAQKVVSDMTNLFKIK